MIFLFVVSFALLTYANSSKMESECSYSRRWAVVDYQQNWDGTEKVREFIETYQSLNYENYDNHSVFSIDLNDFDDEKRVAFVAQLRQVAAGFKVIELHQTVPPKQLNIQFGSVCCGIDVSAYNQLLEYLESQAIDFAVSFWGLEGERTVECFLGEFSCRLVEKIYLDLKEANHVSIKAIDHVPPEIITPNKQRQEKWKVAKVVKEEF